MKNLFILNPEPITLHSGDKSLWKIECDTLTDADWVTLAYMGMEKMGWPRIKHILSVPTGGDKFAKALEQYQSGEGITLLVDDVLTTGRSMETHRSQSPGCRGLVVFARWVCPDWITAIWHW